MTQTRNGEVYLHAMVGVALSSCTHVYFPSSVFSKRKALENCFLFPGAPDLLFVMHIHFSLSCIHNNMHGLHDILSVSAARTQELVRRKKFHPRYRKNNEAGGARELKGKRKIPVARRAYLFDDEARGVE